ncbi:MAG: sensor histidine kinase [Longibaculum sp.]
MTVKNYLQDKVFVFLAYIMMMIMTLLMLLAFDVNISLVVLIMSIDLVFIGFIEIFDYQRKKQFYHHYLSQLQLLEEKYLICELIKEPSFLEGKILYQSLYEINKSMLERINDLSMNIEDFKDYVEMWIHEVKIPLSHLTLTVHNHRSDVSLPILEQIRKLENQVDQILYYVRSQSAQKDYLVKNNLLSQMIKNVIVKNKDYFICHQLKIQLKDLDYEVVTDSKWLEFMVNQVLNNSFQYSKNTAHSYIEISAHESQDAIVLSIYDNGIGICASDLPRVFEKSFTGENGRKHKKSTGMGLYICRKLCDCLGHDITIESQSGVYTRVNIVFYKNDYYQVVQ